MEVTNSICIVEEDISFPPKRNMEISFGDGEIIIFSNVKKTLYNRFRYWMLCKFFPFTIVRWDKD